jgi:hypothetical protein
MITEVKVNKIERSIIRVCVLTLYEFVMFSNNMSRNRVQAQSEQCSQNQIYNTLKSEVVIDQEIPGNNTDGIQKFQDAGRFGADDIGAETIEQGHDTNEQELLEGASEETDFPLGR